MLPGTYNPSPLEAQVFARERLRSALPVFSLRLGDVERRYIEMGVRYHSIPLTHREQFGISFAHIFDPHFPDDGNATPIDAFKDMRRTREVVRLAVHNGGDAVAAEAEVDAAVDRVRRMEYILTMHEDAMEESTMQIMAGGAWRESTPAADLEAMAELRREWILTIPSVVSAIELGVVDEEQALEMTSAALRDDRFEEFIGYDADAESVDSGEEG